MDDPLWYRVGVYFPYVILGVIVVALMMAAAIFGSIGFTIYWLLLR